MKFPRLKLWMWGTPDEEKPLSLPVTPMLSRAGATRGQGSDFIGGADAYWCPGKCWGVVAIRHQREQLKCPECGGEVVYVARIMADVKMEG